MKFIDYAVPVIFIALVLIVYFFGVQWELYVSIIIAAIVIVATIIKYVQYRKIKELEADKDEKQD